MLKKLVFNTVMLCVVVACNTRKHPVAKVFKNDIEVNFFADNGFGNAVAVVQHPAGIYHNGVTYVCYQGPKEDPYVASYNHKTEHWQGPFKAGVSEMGKDSTLKKKIDNHGKPSMLIDDEGYIHITFGGHGGMEKHGHNLLGNYHYGKNLHAVSNKPLDISSWETLDNIPAFGTYNQFIKMDNGDIYLFYRHGAHRSDWVYQVSTDHGRTFSEPTSFLKHKRRNDLPAVDSWYPWITKGKGDKLHVVFDYHYCSDNHVGEKRNMHLPKRYNIYYMTFNVKTGVWKNVLGEALERPITRQQAEAKCLVAETKGQWTFQGVIDVDSKGFPHIGMTVGAEIEGARRSAPKSMHYYRWDGADWIYEHNAGLPLGNGDLKVNSKDEVRFYIADKGKNGQREVARWDATSDGESFMKSKSFLISDGTGFSISALIENPHPDAQLIIAEHQAGTDFRKMYLLGDKGPIKRVAKEAQLLKN